MSLFKNDIEECLLVLNKGGLILYPTDTIWGIGCDATNATAIQKIYDLKKRVNTKTMIILVGHHQEIMQYVNQPDQQIFDYIKGIRKPTTVIYEGAIGLADNIINEDGTIAIRVVKDSFCKELIQVFGKPIVSTSANVSGYPSPGIFNDIDMAIKKGVDYIVQHRQNDFYIAEPSAIIRWNKNDDPTIIRS